MIKKEMSGFSSFESVSNPEMAKTMGASPNEDPDNEISAVSNDNEPKKISPDKDTNVAEKYIRWFSDLSRTDIEEVGEKAANMGELYDKKFLITPGFVITNDAFLYFVRKNKIEEKIKEIFESIDISNIDELIQKSEEIKGLINNATIPEDLETEIIESYHILNSEPIEEKGVSQDALNILKQAHEPIFVSVRSSISAKSRSKNSFAGQQDTYLNIKGDKKLLNHIKKCFASLYNPRSIYYMKLKKSHVQSLATIVQKMIDAERSGVILTKNPLNSKNELLMEAIYGLGEGLSTGKIKPDSYVITKDLEIKTIKSSDKKVAIVRTSSGTSEIVRLNSERSISQVLSQGQILEVANLALKVEEVYKKPLLIEFAIEESKIYILQVREIFVEDSIDENEEEISGNLLASGLPSSRGIGTGHVRIINELEDLKKIKKGDIVLIGSTDPEIVLGMEKANAIISEKGGASSHAVVVAREFKIPCVIGAEDATEKITDGMLVTVDGNTGKIYEGEVETAHLKEIKPVEKTSRVELKIIADTPEIAEKVVKTGINAIGLTRIEWLTSNKGKHPLQYEKENSLDDYERLIEQGLFNIATNFVSVQIRTSDIRSDEHSSLKGSPDKEHNPLMGLHGIRFSLKHPNIFMAELRAIQHVAQKNPEKEFKVMIPHVIGIEEIKKAKEIFYDFKEDNIEFGVVVETPAAVQIIDDICDEIEFISIGLNDLVQLTLGIDRDEESVKHLHDESHPAVVSQLKRIIGACKRNKIKVGIYGIRDKGLVRNLVRRGIDSITAHPDSAYDFSVLIKELELEREKEIQEEIKVREETQRQRKEEEERKKREEEEKRLAEEKRKKEEEEKKLAEERKKIQEQSRREEQERRQEIEQERKEAQEEAR
ncbi:hypothetical protein GOV14_03140, partial [Candidatus Pacearchaeota archaeon]|nr:hypothetical protein [Candidatus Pacearchaeota archaeon]